MGQGAHLRIYSYFTSSNSATNPVRIGVEIPIRRLIIGAVVASIEEQQPEILFWSQYQEFYALRHDKMGAAYYNMSLFSEQPNFHYPRFFHY